MDPVTINVLYDQISLAVKNSMRHSYPAIGKKITSYIHDVKNINPIYDTYPALLDIAELAANIEHLSPVLQKETLQQIKYKLTQLVQQLPEIG